MNYNRPQEQKTAGIIRYSCGILFMLFTFCYLFFLQGDLLAEAQFVYSHGVTSYNLLVGASIITLVLQTLQWVVGTLSRLPSRWHALSYLPSFLLLTVLTSVNRDVIAHFSFGNWVWIAPTVLIVYVLAVVLLRQKEDLYRNAVADIRSQLYPNYIQLFLFMLVTGAIPKATDVYHYELKAERLILEGRYDEAAAVGQNSLRTTARLTQLRMYALSKQGLLAERLFTYPQYDGSRGLLDVADTLTPHRFGVQNICFHLGALCGHTVASTDRYYQLVLGDTIWNDNTIDYYLCSLLLERRLKDFQKALPRYYQLGDSVPDAYNRLPRAYREALLLVSQPSYALRGKIVVGADTLATLSDQEMLQRFRDYQELKTQLTDPAQRVNSTHREFGHTYWWYYDHSSKATGELAPRL